ncbi:Ig-like domain-containing protein [Solirubrobacter soli]|uniref:Ig-like domain-containing protein n=1 Tax=Solirubrobacter soli TaxID=363832 RepID=UPI000428BE2E|nr:Ig-like domain-containing protein [Solirubrobacter soli]
MRRTFLPAGALAALAALTVTTTARAGTINVPAGDPAALIAAITTANGTPDADTINVTGVYAFSAANNFWYGPNALPAITSDITIAGDTSTGATIQSTAGTRLRFFFVSGGRSGLSAGTLRLTRVQLANGLALGGSTAFGGGGAGMGGAVYNQGTLTLDGVTMSGNTATGGTAGNVNSNSGGGMGQDGQLEGGGGFGGSVPASAGTGGNGGAAAGGGGGGGGYAAGENGANGGQPGGGAGGGSANGLGGANASGTRGGNGSGAGGQGEPGQGAGGAGGAFGAGGASSPAAGGNRGGSGGGGVGGGGGGGSPMFGGGSGGFGGGGGWANYRSGSGGFGAGGAGGDGRVAGAPPGKGGFGGGDGGGNVAGTIGVGGGGAGMGGAIFNDRGTVTAVNSTFAGNTVTGGTSTSAFIGGVGSAGEGGDALGAAIFNLNGTLTLTHATIAGNTATAGTGSTNGVASGSIATVGYDSAVARTAITTIRQSIVTAAGTSATTTSSPTQVADGTTNLSTFTQTVTGGAYVGTADPQLAALGDYGGPTRTMAPNPGSPVIGAATAQGLATTDQRGFPRDGAADIGAVETQATSVAVNNATTPFSATARSIPVSATMTPARGDTAPGTFTFSAGAAGSGSVIPTSGSVSASLAIPAGAAPGTYTLTGSIPASPGFGAGTGTATLRILNPPQVCKDVSGTTPFETAITINTDCAGVGPVTVAAGTAAHGTVTIVSGALRYTPAAGYAGSDEFTYTTTNEGGVSNTAKATVKVLNKPQVCKDVSGTTPFQTAITLNTDCTGAGPATVAAGSAAHGSVAIVAGALRYTPEAGFIGTDEFTYTTTNEGGASNAAKASVKVLAPPPVCSPVSATTAFETAVSIAVDCTRTGTVAAAAAPAHGTVSVVAGALRYTPAAGYAGSDEFTYTVTNEGGTSNTAKATVKVLNAPQVCKDVSTTTPFQTAVAVGADCTGAGPGTVTIVAAPDHGTATVEGSTLRYTPASGYAGTDSFTYRATNEGGASNTANVSVKVLNAAQACKDVSATTAYQTAVTIDRDCAGAEPGTLAVAADPSHGTVTVVAGALRYTPAAGYIGADEFTYTVTNEGGTSNAAKASVRVLAPPPTCKDVKATTPYETRIEIPADCSRSGSPAVSTAPSHGTATIAEGAMRYTPAAGFSGKDTFRYTSMNEGGVSESAEVEVTVLPPAPTCASYTTTAGAGRARTLTLACVSVGAPTYAIVGSPAHGTLTGFDPATGTVVYTSDDAYKGTDTFTYRASNAGGGAVAATVTIAVAERPGIQSAPSGGVTLGGTVSATAAVSPRFDPKPGDKVEFRLYKDGCTGAPVFTDAADVDADGKAASGQFTPTAAGAYAWQATYLGDAGNLPVTGTCDPVTVTAPPTVQPATVQPAEAPVCGDPVVLLDVSPVGKQARVSGIVRRAFAGREVTILRAGKAVGAATVTADGAFAATVDGPAAGDVKPVMYTAAVDGNRSRAFRYDRYVRITKRSGMKITGRLAINRKPKTATVLRVNVCTGRRTATTIKVSPSGAFTFTMRGPDAGSPYVLYRVTAKLAGNGKTYTTQVAAT